MCYIIVKNSAQRLSSDYIIGARRIGNKDGAGCMFIDNNRVVIKKILPGTDDNGDDAVRALYEQYQDRAMAFHVRNQSIGPVTLDNAHPFWVTNKDWGHPHDIAMMHNGTIKDVQIDCGLSDTGNVAAHILRPLLAEHPELYDSDPYWFQLSCWIGSNKLVFLRDDGKFVIVNPGAGRILEGSGVWVSGKVSIRPISPDGKTQPFNVLMRVPHSNAEKNIPLSPDSVSWAVETDGHKHIRIVGVEDAQDVGEVAAIIAKASE